MADTNQHGEETLEGTWEEVVLQTAKLDGHRVRVTILPDSVKAPTGRYAARVRAALARQADMDATPEEIAEAEREMRERMESLNEDRRRSGAEPLF